MTEYDFTDLSGQLESKYGPVVAQNITDLILAFEEGRPRTLNCLAILQLSELACLVRQDMRGLIGELRLWDNIVTLLAYNSIPIEQKSVRLKRWRKEDQYAAELSGFVENLHNMAQDSSDWASLDFLIRHNRDFAQSKLVVLQERFEEELRFSKMLWRDFLIMQQSYLKRYGQPVNEKTLQAMMNRADVERDICNRVSDRRAA